MRLISQKGLGLTEMLISIGIMAVVMMSILSVITNQSKEARALTEKLAASDLGRSISSTLISQATCSLLFTRAGNVAAGSLTFNPSSTTYPFSIFFNAIPQSATTDVISVTNPLASGLSPTLQIKSHNSIYLQVETATTGTLKVSFDQSTAVRPIKDLSFPLTFQGTTSGSNLTITSCVGAGGSGTGFGPYDLRTFNTSYTAVTDGLIIASTRSTPSARDNQLVAVVDGTNRAWVGSHDSAVDTSAGPQTLTLPVPKGSSWRVNLVGGDPSNMTVVWISLGSP